jgi:hypothetical protein
MIGEGGIVVLNSSSVFLILGKIIQRAWKPRPYLDNRELFVRVGAGFPCPQTMNIEHFDQ